MAQGSQGRELAGPGRGDISRRHGEEWELFRRCVMAPLLESLDADSAKTAKAIADVIKICHQEERKAHDFGEGIVTPQGFQIGWEG